MLRERAGVRLVAVAFVTARLVAAAFFADGLMVDPPERALGTALDFAVLLRLVAVVDLADVLLRRVAALALGAPLLVVVAADVRLAAGLRLETLDAALVVVLRRVALAALVEERAVDFFGTDVFAAELAAVERVAEVRGDDAAADVVFRVPDDAVLFARFARSDRVP